MESRRFGLVLRELIARDFPSQVAFAHHIGLSPARVSQLVNEAEPNLTYPAIAEVLEAFAPPDQMRLYEGWLASHAPPPVVEEQPNDLTDDAVEDGLRQVNFRIEHGEARMVIRELRRSYETLSRGNRQTLALRTAAALAETLYSQDRRAEGLRIVDNLLAAAQASGDQVLVADGLRLRVLGLRPLKLTGRFGAVAALRNYESFLEAVGHHQDAKVWKDHRSSLVRDRGLLAWELSRRGIPIETLSEVAQESIRREAASNDHPIGAFLALEAGARVALARHDLDMATQLVERAATAAGSFLEGINGLELSITSCRLLAAQGRADDAIETTSHLLDRVDADRLVHYHRELTDFMSILTLSPVHPRRRKESA